jgi:hypothetical protein
MGSLRIVLQIVTLNAPYGFDAIFQDSASGDSEVASASFQSSPQTN